MMKAIILAAGRSRRLFPITHRKPKCLLEVDGRALIDRLIDTIEDNPVIDEIVIVTGFRFRLLTEHVQKNHPDAPLSFVEAERYAETLPAYGLWVAREYLGADILYLNSDILCDSVIIHEIVHHPRESVTAVQQTPWDAEEVNVVTDEDGIVRSIGKQISASESTGEFIGVTKLDAKFSEKLCAVLDIYAKADDWHHFAADAINETIIAGGTLYVHDVTHYKAHEIDTIEDYEHAKHLTL
jgi:choline kinase